MKLGGPKLTEERTLAAGTVRNNANALAIIREVQRAGAGTLRDIADALNARGITTARKGRWHP